MLGNVETLRAVRIVVSAPEELAEDGVVWLLHALRLDVPTGEVIL